MTNLENFNISDDIVLFMKEDNEQLMNIDNEDIQYMVSMLITDYFSTISRGLARSKNNYEYVIVSNSQFNTELLPGLFFRIPITLQNREKFINLLVKDLVNSIQTPQMIGLYGVLEKTQEQIILKNIHKAEKKVHTEYIKATVFVPE